ncbi:294_t:CDS:2 [Entrophospora sp. SA101]|nr:294_t:CDS:2 [Entrophospora sp. SA101]
MSTKRRTTLTALQKKELCLLKQRDPNIPNVELAVYCVGDIQNLLKGNLRNNMFIGRKVGTLPPLMLKEEIKEYEVCNPFIVIVAANSQTDCKVVDDK